MIHISLDFSAQKSNIILRYQLIQNFEKVTYNDPGENTSNKVKISQTQAITQI